MAAFDKVEKAVSVKTERLDLSIEDGILYCVYQEVELLDIHLASLCVQDRLNFAGGQSYPSLFDITHVKHSTKEARDYLANEGNEGVVASAIIVSSPMLKMAANFYIKVNRPKNPTRMFTGEDEAIQWLSQYK
ncbi:hypothetical protein [uncultured Pontibacter sp.]|uniref:DUF7793 family protein n=1 Tax=uncultured Pontibacter sp. TaxID=453356 RepID=UPI0026237163|nr:hypothetical protein [uncultured Pontibacter sp.]